MNNKQIQLKLASFRAINEANINLNGITVVSGINGSGKSTLSKILYYFFKISNNFEEEVYKNYRDKLSRIRTGLDYLTSNFANQDKNYSIKNTINLFDINVKNLDEALEKKDNIISFIDSISNDYFNNIQINGNLKRVLEIVHSFIFFMEDMPEDFFYALKKEIEDIFDKVEEDINSRPSIYLKNEIGNIFNTDQEPSFLEVLEMKNRLFSYENDSFSNSLFIKNSIYIDSPMAFKSSNEYCGYWDDLNELLDRKLSSRSNTEFDRIIVNEILQADIDQDENINTNLVYRRKFDNLMLYLQECATGIKSVAIIYALIKNGSINDGTLLIIDEPEVHLHPQWIVEYARILVLLHKYLGCQIFISSHNPDMIQAIRYISENHDILDNVDFYLAKEDSNKKYTYDHLSTDIEPIFECFNVSFEKIEKYSLKD